jgi:hypothetical protein
MGLRSWNRCIKSLDERNKTLAEIIFKYVEEKKSSCSSSKGVDLSRPCSWAADMGGLFTGHN